ncbi:MAG: hypothetical protein AABX63_03635 [Nanoarchaeota archaeon]
MIKNKFTKKTVIDYYIFIDYSFDLIGYNIIEKEKIPEILQKIVKLGHYKKERHRRTYLAKIKKSVKKSDLIPLLHKQKILHMKDNILIFLEVIEFIKNNDNCAIFLSVDNNQFSAFTKLLNMIPHKKHLTIVKESNLKIGSIEYRLSLIIDNMLVIERVSK